MEKEVYIYFIFFNLNIYFIGKILFKIKIMDEYFNI